MRASSIFLTLWLTLAATSAWAQPPILRAAPAFTLNDMVTLCEVNQGGRVVLKYDVRRLGGSGIKIQLYPGRGENYQTLYKEYCFDGPVGTAKLDLHGVPILVYRVQGIAIDAPVYLCWGGGRAWRAYDNPISFDPDRGRKAPPFMGATAGKATDQPSIELDPPGLVLNEGQAQQIDAVLHHVRIDEVLDWKMEGDGDFKVINNRSAVYAAPKGAKVGKTAVITVSSREHPELNAALTVIVTGIKSGEIIR
jgi:hypothetical protein